MGITIPYQSQAQIAVAGGGRAANYVGASTFRTPGQSAMPEALDRLAGGMNKLGGALHEVGIERQRMQNNRDILEDELTEKDAYRTWREEYEDSHQGADAREAAQATEQYFQTRMGGLHKKWGGNPHLMQTVEAMMAPIRTGAMDHAVRYSDQQDRLHLRAVTEKALGETLRDFADPNKTTAELSASLGSYEASLRAVYGQQYDKAAGAWIGGIPEAVDATLMQAKQAMYAERADSLIAAGRFGEARTFIKANARELGGKANNAMLMIEHKIEAAESRRLRVAESELKAQRAGIEKDIYAKAYDKSLTRADVEAARDMLTPDDYFKMLKLIGGESSLPDKSDPEALIALQRMAVAGDSALQDTADDFLRSGSLTNSDYSKMLNEGQQWRKPVLRQVDEALRLKTGYSEMNPNPDAGNSYLMARDDFQTWLDSEAGQRASDDEKIRMANRVGDNYRIAQAESILSLPVPLFLVGSRTMPDIKATIAATNKARAEGRMTETEYAEQARRIKRMADLLERQAQETRTTQESRR